jgi:hypothetical protein
MVLREAHRGERPLSPPNRSALSGSEWHDPGRTGGVLQDPNFNSVGNDTGHTVGYCNRVSNDGTDWNDFNGERPV